MKTALWLKADGTSEEVKPKNGTNFKLKELQAFVRGMIEIITFPSGKLLVCNEEGKLQDEIHVNETATKLWYTEFPRDKYQHLGDDFVAGDVLIADSDLIN